MLALELTTSHIISRPCHYNLLKFMIIILQMGADILPISNPYFLVLILYVLLGLLITVIPPIRSLRLGVFLVYAYSAWKAYRWTDVSLLPRNGLEIYLFVYWGLVLYASTWLWIDLTYPPSHLKSFWSRLYWIYQQRIFNPRGSLHHLPAFRRHDPSYIPSRTRFLTAQVLKIVLFSILIRAFHVLDQRVYWANLRPGDYSAEKEKIIRRLFSASPREYLIRLWLPLQHDAPLFCCLNILHSALGFVGVSLGGEPSQWRPLFGDCRDCFTVRRYWRYMTLASLKMTWLTELLVCGGTSTFEQPSCRTANSS